MGSSDEGCQSAALPCPDQGARPLAEVPRLDEHDRVTTLADGNTSDSALIPAPSDNKPRSSPLPGVETPGDDLLWGDPDQCIVSVTISWRGDDGLRIALHHDRARAPGLN